MKLFGKTAKIVKVKDFGEYAVEVHSYFFGIRTLSYQILRGQTYWTEKRGDIYYKGYCLGTYKEALQIYNEYYGNFEEIEG